MERKWTHVMFAVGGIVLAWLLTKCGEWAWSYFGKPNSFAVVHTYSGHENKARLSLQERVKQMGKDAQFGQILIPTESVLELKGGQRRTTTRKFYPGYMFVQMELNEETFHLVKNTPKITGFL